MQNMELKKFEVGKFEAKNSNRMENFVLQHFLKQIETCHTHDQQKKEREAETCD